MPDVEWAIPSHARADRVNALTLRLLAERGVPATSVRLFVTPALVGDYRAAVDPGLVAEVVPGWHGVGAQHNGIASWYPEGTRLVHLDDDLTDVRARVNEKQTEPVADLGAMATDAFVTAGYVGAGLWGVYSILNPMFMKAAPRAGLWFCGGGLFGTVNTHAGWARVTLDQKDDYERTLRWWAHDGVVLRMDNIAFKTRMYGAGGMQAVDQPDRQAANEAAVQWLQAMWPGQVRRAKRVGKAGAEIRLVA